MIIATLTNILLDLFFVTILHWGIKGVAFATVISQGGAFISAILYLNKTHALVKFSIRSMHFDQKIFKQSMRIGLPSGFQQSIVALGLIALFWIVNRFGTNVVAAYSVAIRIDSLASMPAMNFAAALSTFVGQNLGAGKPGRVKEGLKSTLLMSSSISVLISLLAIAFSRSMIGAFTNDPNVIEVGSHYLIIVSSFYILFSTLFVLNGVMRGAGDTLIPMFITLFALWFVRIPASYFLSEQIGETGIWWAVPIGWFLGMMLSWLYYLTGRWKKKTVVNKDKLAETIAAPIS